jgi:hypothetical protein
MDRTFRDDDREKRVVTSDGATIGSVRDVDGDRATVERTNDDDSLTDEITDLLGWDDDDETHELRRDHVDRVDEGRVYVLPRH